MPILPIVSVIIANYNGAGFIADAIGSACRQTQGNIEIIVSDDASTDTSVEIVSELMTRDPRIRLIRSDRNGGPAAARNRALAVATGEWIAVLDSDDLMHPERLTTLVGAAERDEADIVADDLLFFDTDRVEPPRTLLRGRLAKAAFWVGAERFVRANFLFGRGLALGYLKPIFRSSLFAASGVRYDERLRLAEDFDFVFRLLHFGARFRVYPLLLYFYRRHSGSISHRLTPEIMEAMIAVDRATRERLGRPEPKLASAMDGRTRSIHVAFAFDQLVSAIKRRNVFEATRIAIRSPRAAMLLRLPVAERLRKLARIDAQQVLGDRRQVCVLTRKRVVGPAEGSLIYARKLVRDLARRGLDVHFVSFSPTVFGCRPYLSLRDEMAIFRTVRVRGTWQVGQYLLAISPSTLLHVLAAFAQRVLLSKGMTSSDAGPSASRMMREDQVFLAKYLPGIGDMLIAWDYDVIGGFGYAMRPDAKTVVISETVSSAEGDLKRRESENYERLAGAQVVVADKKEAEVLRRQIPRTSILVAPAGVQPVASPQAGCGDKVLFVGKATAANVDGIVWFINECWPHIRSQRPDVTLCVAGSVCTLLNYRNNGVQLLGLVSDLERQYSNAGVVILPQRVVSNATAELIDAIARGKAIVAASAMTKGSDGLLRDGVRIEDEPARFSAAVIDYLDDMNAREKAGGKALLSIEKRVSTKECDDYIFNLLHMSR
jgi:GT2 family glycosyltransferase